jgi:chorismate mutase/prephenate dehydratase
MIMNSSSLSFSSAKGLDLDQVRSEINQLDAELVQLLNQRARLSIAVGQLKESGRESVFKPFREKDVLDRILAVNPGPLPAEHLQAIYREILSSSRSLQRPQRVVYLGPEGTFSYYAGLHYLGQASSFSPCPGLEGVFRAVRTRQAELGIIPLENSLQGSVGQSLDLFLRFEVFIQAEIYCRISHSLLSNSENLSDIQVVYSHPQALQQCTTWLSSHLPQAKIVPMTSTAAGAERVQTESGAAAIAHPGLARSLGLHVLSSGIEDLPENWTRFLIIGPDIPPQGNRDKTSLVFTLSDRPGSLATVLNLLAREGVNMKKLESRPSRNERWQYVFFADVECDLSALEYTQLMQDLEQACHSLRILGSYPNGPGLDLALSAQELEIDGQTN